MKHTRHQLDLNMQRRQFLGQAGVSAGALALNSLLADESLEAAPTASALAFPKRAHFAPRAKNVIFLFMAGAPSQLDLFEPKPEMKALHGEPVPGSFLEGLDDALIRGSARIFASPRSFRQYANRECTFLTSSRILLSALKSCAWSAPSTRISVITILLSCL